MKIPKLAKKFMLKNSHYDSEKADFVTIFIEQLKHTKAAWAGLPFKLLPWQSEIIKTVFGVINEVGNRQCRTCYVEIAKKQGKTTVAAALALYLF